MGRPSKYTDDERAAVQMALAVSGGNVERSSRDTGIPAQTVRDWKKKWEREGTPELVVMKAEEQADDFVAQALVVRDKAMTLLESRLEDVKNPKDLATIVGILTDKINLARGLATSRTEKVYNGPSPSELAASMHGFFAGVTATARERAEVIIDADVEQPKGLPPMA